MRKTVFSSLAHPRTYMAAALIGAALALAGCKGLSGEGKTATQAQQAAKTSIDWQALSQAVGQYPHQAPFLEEPALAQRLKALLGDQEAAARQNLEVSAPLQVEGSVYYITGNRAHMGGAEAVAIAMDEASNSIRVWLLHEGQQRVFSEQGATFAWPRDIDVMISNNQ